MEDSRRRRILRATAVLLAGVVAGLPAGCGRDEPATTPGTAVQSSTPRVARDVVDIAGQRAVVLGGTSPDPRPLLLVVHGYGATADVVDDPRMATAVGRLVEAGWLVSSSDAHGDAWGNSASQDDLVALDDWMRRHHAVSRTVVLGESMGAIASLAVLSDARIPGATEWIGVSPVVDLAALDSDPMYGPPLRATGAPESIRSRDPLRRPAPRVPMTLYTGSGDTTIPPATADAYAATHGGRRLTCPGGHVARPCYDMAVDRLLG